MGCHFCLISSHSLFSKPFLTLVVVVAAFSSFFYLLCSIFYYYYYFMILFYFRNFTLPSILSLLLKFNCFSPSLLLFIFLLSFLISINILGTFKPLILMKVTLSLALKKVTIFFFYGPNIFVFLLTSLFFLFLCHTLSLSLPSSLVSNHENVKLILLKEYIYFQS